MQKSHVHNRSQEDKIKAHLSKKGTNAKTMMEDNEKKVDIQNNRGIFFSEEQMSKVIDHNDFMLKLPHQSSIDNKRGTEIFRSSDFIAALIESNNNAALPPTRAATEKHEAIQKNITKVQRDSVLNFLSNFGLDAGKTPRSSSNDIPEVNLGVAEEAKEDSDPVNQFPRLKSSEDDPFTSKDWMGHYIINHVDIDYSKKGDLFGKAEALDELNSDCNVVATNPAPSQQLRNPISRLGFQGNKTDWFHDYEKAMSAPHVEAINTCDVLLQQHDQRKNPIVVQPGKQNCSSSVANATDSFGSLVPTALDILLGRGGKSNNHVGNQRYLKEVDKLKKCYRNASKTNKTDWSQCLVDTVRSYGGRFLKYDKEAKIWYEVPNKVARKKSGQALREDNTAESRLMKRRKYKKSKRPKH